MEAFAAILSDIENPEHRARTTEVLAWVAGRFPALGTRVAWGQPMFTDHGTFILSLKVSKKRGIRGVPHDHPRSLGQTGGLRPSGSPDRIQPPGQSGLQDVLAGVLTQKVAAP